MVAGIPRRIPPARGIRLILPAAILALAASVTTAFAAPLAGTYVVGSGGDYGTITAAVADLVARGVSAPVSFLIKTGTYNESVDITAVSGSSATNRVRFVAQSGNAGDVTWTATANSNLGADSPVRLDGCSNVDVDSLTVTASGSSASSAALIWMSNSATGDRVRGCVLNAFSSSRSAVRTTNSAVVDGLQVVGCQMNVVGGTSYALYIQATSSNNLLIQGNTMSVQISSFGINLISAGTGIVIQGNTLTGGTVAMQINPATGMTIRANRVTGATTGISLGNLTSGCLVANNFVQSTSSSALVLSNGLAGGVTVAFNSLNGAGTGDVLSVSAGPNGLATLKDNVIASTGGGIPLTAAGTTMIASSNFNDLYSVGPTLAKFNTVSYATIAAITLATAFESNSIEANPAFVSSTDLHVAAPALNGAGTPVGTVLDDIDGDTRDATHPDIGADEFNTGLTPMAGTYTVGGGGTYATITAAITDVVTRGLAGPVSLLLASGTYNESVYIPTLTGASATNRLRIVSQSGNAGDVIWAAPGTSNVGADSPVRLDGGSNVDLDSLTINATGSGSNNGAAVWMSDAALADRLRGCVSSTVSNSQSFIRTPPAGNMDGLEVRGCQITVVGSSSNGIFLDGISANNTVIQGNTFSITSPSTIAVNTSTTATGVIVQGNTFNGGSTAIQMNPATTLTIRANRIVGPATGIALTQVSAGCLMANNFIQSAIPITIASPFAGGITLAFNSINATGANDGVTITAGVAAAVTLRDNVIVAAGGIPINVATNVASLASSDYNDLYTTGPTLAKFNTVTYATIAAITSGTGYESHSIEANPAFVSVTDLHASAPALNGAGTPAAGILDDIDGDTRDATHPDIGADEFNTVLTMMAGTYTVGGGGTYGTISAAMADVVLRGLSGPVSLLLATGTYNESVYIPTLTGSSVTNRLRIVSQSGNPADVTWTAVANSGSGTDAPVRLDGGSNVDIDSLTIIASGTSGSNGGLVWMSNAPMGDRLRGCVLNTSSSNRSGVRTPTSAYIDGFEIRNCQITIAGASSYGFLSNGGTANNVVIQGCTFTTSASSSTPIYVNNIASNGTLVQGNTISGGSNSILFSPANAITIRGNRATGATNGISLTTTSNGCLVANNFVQSIGVPLSITSAATGGLTVAFNSFHGNGGTGDVVSISSGAAGGVTLKNNVIVASAGGLPLDVGASTFLAASDYNDLYTTGQSLVRYNATFYATLAAITSATGFESHSIEASPAFVSATDLHVTAPALNGAGTPLGAVLDDIDGDTRDATHPDIGADEYNTTLTPMAGTYTVGGGGAYATITAAMADLVTRGLAGPVSLLLASGTYNESVYIPTLTGASATNRLRIVSQSGNAGDVTWVAAANSGNGTDSPVRLDGGSNVDLDSLTITANGTGSGNGAMLWLTNAAVGDRLRGCVLNTLSGSRMGVRSSTIADGLQVLGCQITVANSNGTGIYASGTSGANCVIQGNAFTMVPGADGVYVVSSSASGTTVVGNTFNGGNQAIQFNPANGITIRGNRITNATSGISLSNVSAGCLVANNMVQCTGAPVLIQAITTGGATVVFNTFSGSGTNDVLQVSGSAGALTLENNVLAALGGSTPLTCNNVTSPYIVADYNDLYTTGSTLAKLGNGSYATLPAYTAATGLESHSVQANPGFVSATDLHVTAPALNGAGTPAAGILDDIDGDTRDAVHPDIGADEFNTALTPMAGSYTVGGGGTYATITAAVNDVVTRGLAGPVSLLLATGTYNESVYIPTLTGSSVTNRLRIVSQSGNAGDVTWTGPATSNSGTDSPVRLDGASNVDVDSLTVTGSASGGSTTALVWMYNTALGDRFRGCIMNATLFGRNAIRAPSNDADGLQVLGCQVTVGNSGIGIYSFGGTSNNVVIQGCTFNLASNALGLYLTSVNTGVVIQGNTMTGGAPAITMNPASGATIRGNKISTTSSNAVSLTALSNNCLVANNFIQSSGTPVQIFNLNAAGALSFVYNSLNGGSANDVLALTGNSANAITLKDNILASAGNGIPLTCSTTGTILASPDYNDFFTGGATLVKIASTLYPTLAAYRTATGFETHGVNVNPSYVSTTDLHTAAPGLDGAATPIANVLDDIDGQLRNATTPDIGADEFTNGVVDHTPPNTSFTSGPADGSWINAASPSFGWIGADDISLPATLRYETSFDGGAYSAPTFNTSGTFGPLTEGAHSLAVVAIDEAGNIDPTPASRAFNVDLTAPDTQILTGPAEASNVAAANAIFTVGGTDNLTPTPQLQYSYRVDGGTYSAPSTTTTISLTSLALGAHTLDVRAQDLAGNLDATPVTRHFTIALIYDLTADWSDGSNPNGPWAYREGGNLLSHFAVWSVLPGDWITPQPAWARFASGTSSLPGIFRASGTYSAAHDWQNGDVILHSTDATNGIGSGPGNITWTNPSPATVTISGAAWIGKDIGRSNHWSLSLNGTVLTGGDVFSGDPYSRTNPMDFATGSGGAGAISNLTLAGGDVIKLEVDRNSVPGEFTGLRMQVQTVPISGIAPQPVLIAGPANGGTSGTSTAFTWTVGAHSSPRSSITFATRLDAALTSAFLPDTMLSLSGLSAVSHTLWVIAKDDLNRRDSTTVTWTVDAVPPTVAFTGGPSENGYSMAAPTFSFTGTDNLTATPNLRYAYSLDGGAFSAVSTSTSASLGGLAAGAHTLAVHSVDQAGNTSTDAVRHWTVDLTSPDTQILTGPANGATVDGNSVTYTVLGSDDATPTGQILFQQQLDGAAYTTATATTSRVFSGLSDGPHSVQIRAVDLAGNVDATPVQRTFTSDALPPTVTILTGPPANSCQTTTSASFTWSASDVVTPQGSLVYAYSLDGAAFTSYGATTSASYGSLAEGSHTLTVDSRDLLGHIGTATLTWKIDLTTPVANLPTTKLLDNNTVQVTCTGSDAGGVTGYRVQIATDTGFGTPLADVNIGAAGTYSYVGTPGNTYFARATATDCAGHVSAFSGASNGTTVANLPDLAVTQVNTPASVTSGQVMQVGFTVANQGLGATNTPQWYDDVFLSPTASYNAGTAISLGRLSNVTFLAPGDHYTSTGNFTIPLGVHGTYYVVVLTDNTNAVPETDGTNNTGVSSSVNVVLGAYADLQVSQVVGPPTAFSGDSVTVRWTVTNQGSGRSNVDNWYDTVVISSDSTLDYTLLGNTSIKILDTPIGTFPHVGALDPSQSYTPIVKVRVPDGISGPRWFFVLSDLRIDFPGQVVGEAGNVFENGLDLNSAASAAAQITLTPPPDLTVQSITGPASVTAGQPLALGWTIHNVGFNATPATSWSDRVYLSTDTNLDVSSDLLLGSLSHNGSVAVDGTYTPSASFTVPIGLSGTYHVFVVTDANGDLAEYREDNNSLMRATPLTVTPATWPNLVTTGGSVPDSGTAGQNLLVKWNASNTGVAQVSGYWEDHVWLSTSATWNPANAQRLAVVAGTRTLAPGASYASSANFGLPTGYSGRYYVYVNVDGGNSIYENTDEGDNVGSIGSVWVKGYPAVDLAVTTFSAPTTASSGQPLPLSWAVTDAGAGTTLTSSWNEEVWLSTDNVLSPGTDILLATTTHGGSLAPGASYTHAFSPTIANGFGGSYYVIVRVDAAAQSGDASLANNVAVSATPVVISSVPPPNLTMPAISVAASGTAGQPARIHYTVSNTGTGPVPAVPWYISFYLSLDPNLDGSDVSLTSIPGPVSLAAGTSHVDSVDVTLPIWASGGYYVIGQADARNDLYEGGAEGDNTDFTSMAVTLPPPSDLVVQNISIPPVAIPGQPVTVSWTVSNVGVNTASGTMDNAVYVSTDASFQADTDPLIGVQTVSINLPPGATQRFQQTVRLDQALSTEGTGTYTGPLPPVTPGPYYAIVRTNTRDNIRESDLTNNSGASAVTLQADVDPLTLGVSAPLTLSAGGTHFYKVTVAANQDLQINLGSSDTGATNEMYVAFGHTPSLTDFDFSGPQGFTSAPGVLVPSTQAGTYYIQVIARTLGTGNTSENTTLLAQALPFSIASITPGAGGRGGQVTTAMRGAGFLDNTIVRLEIGGVPVTFGTIVKRANSTQMDVRWDLTSLAEGPYDLVAANGANVVKITNGFTIQSPIPIGVVVTHTNADVLRRTAVGTFTINFQNPSNQDLPALRARLFYPASTQLRSLTTSPGLLKRSDRIPGLFAPLTGDVYVAQGPGGDSLAVVELVATHVPPGQTLSVSLDLVGFVTSPYSVRAIAQATPLSTFLDREVQIDEAARQALNASPAGVPPAVLTLASDPFAFRDAALDSAVVSPGLASAAEVTAYLLSLPVILPSPVIGGPSGPSSLLQDLATGTCVLPGPVSECSPDVGPLTSALPACLVGFDTSLEAGLRLGGGVLTHIAAGTLQGYDLTDCANTKIVTPCDPNLLTGPSGYGDQHWVNGTDAMSFRVDFENLSSVATAPAQVVSVNLPLDPHLDPTTFRLGSFGFGSHLIDVPPGRTSYTVQPFFADLGLSVLVTAGVDIVNHKAFWTFTSIDPATGQQPTNPYIGFLPVNDPTGRGTGFANFTIKPLAGTGSGTPLTAQASIKFDANAPLLTVASSNRVDTRDPVSAVISNVDVPDTTRVRVHWTASDDSTGAGLQGVALWMKKDTGAFTLYQQGLAGAQVDVPVDAGHTYAFYALATDNTGNIEPPKTLAEATVLVGTKQVGVLPPGNPTRTALYQNYPNPFRGDTRVRFDLATAEPVTLEVFDIQGRLVSRPLENKRYEPGRYTIVVDHMPRGAGIYFYRLSAGRFVETRRMALLN
jgi:CARDB/Periplasmic copper-binding protein (NosD)/Right handed beta helix region/Bacterial pre-peptidase C-terminal domain